MTRYRERLIPGPGVAAALLLLAPGVYLIILPLDLPAWAAPLGAAIVTAAAEFAVFALSPVVEVGNGELRAGPARIPVAMTGTLEPFRGRAARAARGVGLDARAWTLFRGWVDPVLRIGIEDPDDPAPYWVVSTRRPAELAGAVEAERLTTP